ncbi:tRNA wybutosine-synthesizing protein 4 isoform X1 [Hypanus sabinus]|uniref:tRNA wybutosine-synthesizing protein 4 isoform X1 n=2 Tax=Hypanus sabinus TaxID=79690 RepID=UPI0028C3B97B|nr:tRNA wybutosine-synthesizing protein 4 isoform X1 [Hypanus sabinus]
MSLRDGSEEGHPVSALNKRCRSKKQAGKDAAVQGTNDSSIVSKYSMVNLGYFTDVFLKGFVHKTNRRAPLINRGYYVRAKAVDYSVRCFLKHTKDYPYRQILSLGAGCDSLYFRLKASGELKNVIMYEVDFPDVVQRKATLIKNKQELVELIGCTDEMGLAQMEVAGHLYSMDYKLLGIDLTEITKLDNTLMEIGLNYACPTLLLSEVVLTYMKNESSSAVIRWAAERFSTAVFVVYEQIRPNDPFGQVMQQHFVQLNSTLHALVQFPGKEAQQIRFLKEGWEECFCIDMNEFYVRYIPEQEKQRIELLEPFDEYEEWHLKCSHYMILCASKGDLIKYLPFTPHPDFCTKLDTLDSLQLSVSLCETETQSPHLRRFAHCSVLVGPYTVVTTGGFGNRIGQHGRLKDISLLAKSGPVWKSTSFRDADGLLTERMFHSMTALSDGRCIIIGGRTSPLKPVTSVLCLRCDTGNGGISNVSLSLKAIECSGTMPSPRWRHTATEVIYRDQNYLFIYGGRSSKELVLDDWHFLNLQDYSWTNIPVDGSPPEGRHSHSACTWKSGVVIAGGLGIAQVPLGSVFYLKPTLSGFVWERIQMTSVIPRYSHTAHILDDKLILLGGVSIHTDSNPEVTLIDLKAERSCNYYISTNLVKWPLMLHNHSSLLLAKERQVLVIGGGGNCFSFGTHLNYQPVLLQLPEIY